jgi:hypothetical protein
VSLFAYFSESSDNFSLVEILSLDNVAIVFTGYRGSLSCLNTFNFAGFLQVNTPHTVKSRGILFVIFSR